MANPVVHFEIMGTDAAKTQAWYGELFDWTINADNEFGYGLVEKQEGGIGGGVGANPQGRPMVAVYVQTPDPQATLDKAVSMGATELMGVTELPMVTMAMFADPDGNVVGLVKG